MNAMILAAGRGTRLGALGLTTPKVLVDVGGEPLLARHLRYLADQGFERVVINAHHLAEHIAAFLARYKGPLETTLLKESSLLGTAGGVRNALQELGTAPFLVLYGDVLIDEPLREMIHAHRTIGADATVAVYASAEVEGKGLVELDDASRIRSFVEKGNRGDDGGSGSRGLRTADPRDDEGAAWVNAGVYVLEPSFVRDTVPEGKEVDFGNEVFPAAVGSGRRLFGHVLARAVIDVGTPEALGLARWSQGFGRSRYMI
ncbi:MAG: nucleotidyltransferase family protein [Actinomycetota bacterium]